MSTALVERARTGDQVAFAELFNTHVDRCYAVAYRILRHVERAEDAVQQSFVLAWRDLPTLRDSERFEAWLYRLLVHQCYRAASRHRQLAARVGTISELHARQDDQYVSVEEREVLEHAFTRLSPEQRAVFVLHHHVGMPLATIAEDLNLPLGTVKSRIHYATKLLREAILRDAGREQGKADLA